MCFLQLDFQLCFWTSPIFELLFFISLCCNDEVREIHFDTIIFHYQLNLADNLRTLRFNGKIPSLKDIQMDLLNRGIIGNTEHDA